MSTHQVDPETRNSMIPVVMLLVAALSSAVGLIAGWLLRGLLGGG
jgi:hypothetical protein